MTEMTAQWEQSDEVVQLEVSPKDVSSKSGVRRAPVDLQNIPAADHWNGKTVRIPKDDKGSKSSITCVVVSSRYDETKRTHMYTLNEKSTGKVIAREVPQKDVT